MTENEAIKGLETSIDLAKMCTQNYERKREIQGYEMAINALEEVQQYRTIGTPEECRKSVEICKSMIERNITPEDMEEYMKFEDECISEGFTLKSLLEAGEKQKAKRPDYEGDGYSDGHLVYDTWICPCCGKHYEVDYDDYDFCPACGQCIDWSDEE
jgi:rubrerythrin